MKAHGDYWVSWTICRRRRSVCDKERGVTNMKRVATMQDASMKASENDIISQSVDRRVEWPRPRIAEE